MTWINLDGTLDVEPEVLEEVESWYEYNPKYKIGEEVQVQKTKMVTSEKLGSTEVRVRMYWAVGKIIKKWERCFEGNYYQVLCEGKTLWAEEEKIKYVNSRLQKRKKVGKD